MIQQASHIDIVKSFFEKFFGVGGSFSADMPKTENYADVVSNQPLMMVAEDTATYGTKKDGE